MKGNYTIMACAWPTARDTHTADKNMTGGWVIVASIGDVTGPNGCPDGKVDIRDVAGVARLFGASSPSPRYNANYDINDDGKIEIKDVSALARHFGEVDP